MLAIDQPPQPLTIHHLAAYGYTPAALAAWHNAGITTLLPLQQQALMQSPLLRGGNIVALAPTSAGKTFLAELAAVRNWQAGKKTLFLAPTRALATEQHRLLQTRYAPAGIRVILSTSDTASADSHLRTGDFDFAVLVYEKLRALLVTHPHILHSTGTVIADELQLLGDPDRGETADLLLTRLVHGDTPLQVIGLTAVVNDGHTLARWLDAYLLTSTDRPAELREGVYCAEHACFHYTTGNNPDQWHQEPMPLPGPTAAVIPLPQPNRDLDATANVVRLAATLARQGESVLLFVPTRAISRQACKLIAAELGRPADATLPSTTDPWQDLRETEDSLTRRQLLESIEAGVAFHNADLTADLRLLMEDAFISGRLKVLVATPTLAQGVNLKARNVIQLPFMLSSDSRPLATHSVRHAHVPLSVARYRNQAGRAGRIGTGHAFGRSLLVARNHAEALRLAQTYIGTPAEAPIGRFTAHTMQHFILGNVHAGAAENFSGLFRLLAHTWAYHGGAVQQDVTFENRLADTLRDLLEARLLEETPSHRLQLTGSGQAMAAGGYRGTTMREMMAYSADWQNRVPHPLEALCAVAFTPDAEAFPLAATPYEMKTSHWRRAINHLLQEEGINPGDQLERALQAPGGLSQARHSALKMALIAYAWISNAHTTDLEEQYRLPGGTMHALGAHFAWLLGGLASCASVHQCPEANINQLEAIARRLPLGLCEEAASLANLDVPGLGRQYLNKLATDGFTNAAALRAAPDAILANLLPPGLLQRLRQQYPAKKDTGDTNDAGDNNAGSADLHLAGSPEEIYPTLQLDPNDPGLAILQGQPIRLTRKPYALLTVLVAHASHTVAYPTIDAAVWPGEKVEPQQVSAHKSTLVNEFARILGRPHAEKLITTEPGLGIRLNIPPENITH